VQGHLPSGEQFGKRYYPIIKFHQELLRQIQLITISMRELGFSFSGTQRQCPYTLQEQKNPLGNFAGCSPYFTWGRQYFLLFKECNFKN